MSHDQECFAAHDARLHDLPADDDSMSRAEAEQDFIPSATAPLVRVWDERTGFAWLTPRDAATAGKGRSDG